MGFTRIWGFPVGFGSSWDEEKEEDSRMKVWDNLACPWSHVGRVPAATIALRVPWGHPRTFPAVRIPGDSSW